MRRAQLLMKCLVQNEMARQEKKIKPRGDWEGRNKRASLSLKTFPFMKKSSYHLCTDDREKHRYLWDRERDRLDN
jgi:hypothetical protein